MEKNINELIIPVAQQWENLTISNDYIFCKVMQEKELCAELIRRILPDIRIGRIEFPERQKSIAEGVDVRSVRLDIYTRSEFGSVIDIEMQMLDTGNLPKRTRGYHAVLSMNAMNKDLMKTYDDLPTTFVIFICATFDPFSRGRHIYTFENLCKEDTSLQLNDGAYTIFLTPKGTLDDISPQLRAFLDFVAGRPSDDPFIRKLERRIVEVKQNSDWRLEYMTLFLRDQENRRQGRNEGRSEGRSETLEAAIAFLRDNGIMNSEQITQFKTSIIDTLKSTQ